MRSRVAGTIVSKNYLPLARVLSKSFHEHHPEIPFFVLLADEVEGYFEPAHEPFEMLSLEDLPIPNLTRFRFQHPQQPLSYASTPFFLHHLLDLGFSSVLFYKQEGLVTGDQTPVYERLNEHSIVLTPHLLAPLDGADGVTRELNILQSGVFNIGMLGVSESSEARRFLEWWEDRTYTHCRLDVAAGLHYEQRWVDLVPAYFENVHILRDPGANVGHWNLPEREVQAVADGFAVDGGPGRLFRFSGFEPERPDAVTKHSRRLNLENVGPAAAVFRRYLSLLESAGYAEAREWPYAYGFFDDGSPIPDIARHIFLELGENAERFANPFATEGTDSFFRWLSRPGSEEAPFEISPLWKVIYRLRTDVQQAFPNIEGADRESFLAWARNSGAKEHGIPDVFLPSLPEGRT